MGFSVYYRNEEEINLIVIAYIQLQFIKYLRQLSLFIFIDNMNGGLVRSLFTQGMNGAPFVWNDHKQSLFLNKKKVFFFCL